METDLDKALGIPKLLDWISDFLMWLVHFCAPWAGFILGFSLLACFYTSTGRVKAQKFWRFLVGCSALVDSVAWFFFPALMGWLIGLNIRMPK